MKVGVSFMKFAKRLKELRLKHGFSQENMAQKLGMTSQNYGRFEKQNANPKMETLIKMAQIFGVSIGYLLGVDEIAADTPAGRKVVASYWSKYLQPEFKLEYQEGYFYLTALQNLTLDLFDIEKGRSFKLNQQDFEIILDQITKEIENKRKEAAASYFRTFAESILFNDFILNEMVNGKPTREQLNEKIKDLYFRHNTHNEE